MKRISTATSVPNKFGAGKNGFTDGSVVGGVPATDLQADWFDQMQEEIANVIEDRGMLLDGNSKSQLLAALLGRLVNVRRITVSAAYAKTPGTKYVLRILQGAGGGGGGSTTTTGGQLSVGSGGNSGGVCVDYSPVADLEGQAMVIGAPGAASSPGGAGGNGGATSFGTLSAPGGAGGTVSAASSGIAMAVPIVNTPQSAGGNLFNGSNGAGGDGFCFNGSVAKSGNGANSMFGNGPRGQQAAGGGGNASNFGCGGAGALTGSGGGAAAGGSGGAGVMFLLEIA